jgi:uncharacterized Fe-S cluster protein YjdI
VRTRARTKRHQNCQKIKKHSTICVKPHPTLVPVEPRKPWSMATAGNVSPTATILLPLPPMVTKGGVARLCVTTAFGMRLEARLRVKKKHVQGDVIIGRLALFTKVYIF